MLQYYQYFAVIIKKNMFESEEYSLFFIIKLDDKNTVYSNTLKLP